jgi:hypothetical protein
MLFLLLQTVMDSLPELNHLLERGEELPGTVWDSWLWELDPAEPTSVNCMLNKMHLVGLIIARYRALREPSLTNVVLSLPHVVHARARVAVLTPRQLKDVVEDIQMRWTQLIEDPELEDKLVDTVDACMTRFGEFNLRPFAYDDVNMVESEQRADRMGHTVIRRFASIFLILYRHLHMLHSCRRVESGDTSCVETVQDFHVQASMEAFYRHSMHMDLPPAARLLYREEFAGFYNCISQVIYLHFPEYQRKTQMSLEKIRAGTEPALYSLSPLMEMYPEINLCQEDELWKKNAWNWVVMGTRVYLVNPDKEIFYSKNLLLLLSHFCSAQHRHA